MEAQFWHNKWEINQIGFHNLEVHPMLTKYLSRLKPSEKSRFFIPLCGKTLDISWLLNQGYHVVGSELSVLAIEQLFEQLEIIPQIKIAENNLKHYTAEHIDVFVGDLFDLQPDQVGTIDFIYDRAALVALPAEMRIRYTQHIMALTHEADQLLVCFEYDQTQIGGPPFSIVHQEIERHYASAYHITNLETVVLPSGLKGQVDAKESAWLLNKY